ncbi:bone morphogenetic protein 3 [Plakobranchus ocellatus]|uniref:Bone morphogenetic protein 3 n=1 Tax=Plakobranchus ocellatus TaxID=259542 RepID=A0AAV3ZK48_9GAST|nr:bone morphogenetic protein 3 [Plakobranchus ocellatus]
MNWRDRPLVLCCFLLVHMDLILCRHHSNRSSSSNLFHKDAVTQGPHYPGPKVPGIPISHLTDLSVLDPYNIMSGKSFESDETASLVHQIIPLRPEHVAAFSREGGTQRDKDGHSSEPKSESSKHKTNQETRQTLKRKKTSKDKHKEIEKKLPEFHGALEEDWSFTDDDDILESDELKYFKKHASSFESDKSKPSHKHKYNKGRRKHKRLFTKVEKDRNALLHEAVRKLLGFSASPLAKDEGSRYLPDPTRERRLPRYVKDLYKRFQNGEIGAAGLAKGNTVRSIHTSIGDIRLSGPPSVARTHDKRVPADF